MKYIYICPFSFFVIDKIICKIQMQGIDDFFNCSDPCPLLSDDFFNWDKPQHEYQEYEFERKLLSDDHLSNNESSSTSDSINQLQAQVKKSINKKKRKNKKEPSDTDYRLPKNRTTKNIVKNYGNAIANFASSALALPYIDTYPDMMNVDKVEFQKFIGKQKNTISGIDSFKALLQEDMIDTEEIRSYKRLFKYLAEIFVKYFSVNWIFHSRMKYRDVHLKFRHKMLRRIRNPDLFTYITGTAE
jgi:hypothetical protein